MQLRPLSDADQAPARVCGIDAARRLKPERRSIRPPSEYRDTHSTPQLLRTQDHSQRTLAGAPAIDTSAQHTTICRLTCTCKQVALCLWPWSIEQPLLSLRSPSFQRGGLSIGHARITQRSSLSLRMCDFLEMIWRSLSFSASSSSRVARLVSTGPLMAVAGRGMAKKLGWRKCKFVCIGVFGRIREDERRSAADRGARRLILALFGLLTVSFLSSAGMLRHSWMTSCGV